MIKKTTAETENTKNQKLLGKDLMVDLDNYGEAIVVEMAFWMGVLPQFPTPYINCVGLTFPKLNELLIPDPSDTTRMQRVPVIGALHSSITAEIISRLKLVLPRLVIRFTEPPNEDKPKKSQTVAEVSTLQPRKGFLITIPSDKDIEMSTKGGARVKRYSRQKWDEPALPYMFMQPCVDQENPQRGGVYPLTLDVTGIDVSVFDEMTELLN